MEQKIGIVADSVACVPREFVEQYDIGIVPLNVFFRDKVYRDWIDITPTESYELFLQDPEAFSTSPASPGRYLEVFRETSKKNDKILCITLSARLSTGYEMACVAREQAKNEIPEASIEVMDSANVTAAEGFIAMEAARAASEGKCFPEVIEAAENIKSKVTFIMFLDTIRHVYRTGRIPKIASQFGAMLRVHPILGSSNGVIHFKGAARDKPNGMKRILQMVRKKVGQNPVHVAIMHAYAPDDAVVLKEMVEAEFDCAELWITEFSPIMGYACGTGAVGLAFYQD